MKNSQPIIKEIFFNTCDSTQLYARNNAYDLLQQNKTWYVIRSNQQTSGIGQSNRHWVSPPDNIYATFIIPLEYTDFRFLHYFPLIVAKSVCQVLNSLELNPQIKWVNDILIDNKKISGVLCESVSQGEDLWILVGVGININTDLKDLNLIDQAATSVSIEKGNKTLSKYEISGMFEKFKEIIYENVQYIRYNSNGAKQLIEYVRSNIAYLGKIVRIEERKDKDFNNTTGIFRGITDEGYLKIYNGKEEITIIEGRMFIVRNNLVGVWKNLEENGVLNIEEDNIDTFKGYYIIENEHGNSLKADIIGSISYMNNEYEMRFELRNIRTVCPDNKESNCVIWKGKYNIEEDQIVSNCLKISDNLRNTKNIEEIYKRS